MGQARPSYYATEQTDWHGAEENPLMYSPGCQLSAGTSDFVTIWDLLVISASASADPYIFRVISCQCLAQCRTCPGLSYRPSARI